MQHPQRNLREFFVENKNIGKRVMNMWAYESVFYQIYPLGFCGAPFENDGALEHRILKVEEWIPHIKKLGADAIYFSPIFESDTHGYNTRDYKKIDTRLGTNEDFKKVVDELHKQGIKVVIDGVFNHVGRGFEKFKDVLVNRGNSQYKDWFNINFDGNVEIMGNIIPNMVVRATGYVKVNGYVESASIYAGDDVVLAKGIQGGGISYIEAGGDVLAPFFESTTIKCNGSLRSNHILNCDVTANDSVLLSGKRGLILGGTTRALRYIDATTVGNKAELPTKLILGVDSEIIKEYGETIQSISKVKLEISA